MDLMYLYILIGTLLILAAAFSSLLAYRLGTPLLLLFLGIGLIAGVDGLGIYFDNAGIAYFIGSIALAIILFDSGFGTPVQMFKNAAGLAATLATVGVLITTAVFGVAAHLILELSWLESLLLGAIVSSTDAAAVFFLLRVGGINIRDKVRSTLEIESGSNDPMAVFLTITLVEIIAAGTDLEATGITVLTHFLMELILGVGGGYLGGMLIVSLVNRIQLDRALTPIFVVALAMLVFAVTGAIGGSGFLAVYVAGLFAGSRQLRASGVIRRFQEGVSWLAQILMFLLLGLLATPSQFGLIALPAILLGLFLIFVARPLAVWICLAPFRLQPAEIAFISWVGLRGAVSILLAIVPFLWEIDNGMIFFNTAFIIVIISLLLQGWTINPLARRLGLIVPPRMGAVEKVELELPGTASHELLVYRVVENSPIATGERMPRWARPSLVIRDGKSMRFQYAGRLRPNDYVYLFVPSRHPRLLDRLFALPKPVSPDDTEFFGVFTVDPARSASELVTSYGVSLDTSEAKMSIGDLIHNRVGGRAEYADRVVIKPIELIVRDVDEEGNIVAAGLSLEPEANRPAIPAYFSLRETLILLGDRWKNRKNTRSGEETSPEPEKTDSKAG